MPKLLAQWFAYSVLVSVFAAYVAGRALGPDAAKFAVFQVVGTVAFLAYASTHATDPVWKGERWQTAFKHILDGLLYGLVTAGVFGWLWP